MLIVVDIDGVGVGAVGEWAASNVMVNDRGCSADIADIAAAFQNAPSPFPVHMKNWAQKGAEREQTPPSSSEQKAERATARTTKTTTMDSTAAGSKRKRSEPSSSTATGTTTTTTAHRYAPFTDAAQVKLALATSSVDLLRQGLTRLRNQTALVSHDEVLPANDPRIKLVCEYLDSSPNADELFAAWNLAAKVRRGKVTASLVGEEVEVG